MIIQLAYARLLRALGKLREGGTYESATTRKFAKGRTEVIRCALCPHAVTLCSTGMIGS
jgi:hypothetical protein